MKILLITPYMKPVLGGISTYVDGLRQGLKRRGAVCDILAEKGESITGTKRTDRSFVRFLAEGILAILAFRPSVVHVHSNWRGFLIALPYSWLSRRSALFFTFHTDFLSPLSGFRKNIFEAMLRRCDALIFTSSYLRSTVETSLSVETKSKVVLAGVSKPTGKDREAEELADRLSVGGRFPVLLYMAPLVWKEKTANIAVLGETLQGLKSEGLDPVLVVAGDGPLRNEVEERIKGLGLDEVVVFAGRVENSGAALAASDIYTHISKKESLSMAILEAMSAGKPVIATDVGGTSEILSREGVGLLVSDDLSDVKMAILTLTSNPDEMKAMGDRAREWVEGNFTWMISAENHMKLYQEALSAD